MNLHLLLSCAEFIITSNQKVLKSIRPLQNSRILCTLMKIPWNQFLHYLNSLPESFRQINWLVIFYFVKPLLSRNFCQITVRENSSRNFRTATILSQISVKSLLTRELYSFKIDLTKKLVVEIYFHEIFVKKALENRIEYHNFPSTLKLQMISRKKNRQIEKCTVMPIQRISRIEFRK